MRVIPSKMHGVLDYAVGMLLIVIPWLAGFARGGAETWIPVILGVAALLYSLVTNYELGRWKLLSFKTHLVIDFMSGVLLASSPWLFGFSEEVYMPHLVLGILEMVVVLLSAPVAYDSKTTEARNRANFPAHSQ